MRKRIIILIHYQFKKWHTLEDYQQFDLEKKQQEGRQFNQLFGFQKKAGF